MEVSLVKLGEIEENYAFWVFSFENYRNGLVVGCVEILGVRILNC